MSNNGNVYIQVENGTGVWQGLSAVINNVQIVAHGIRTLAQLMQGKGIRPIDENSRIVDIL